MIFICESMIGCNEFTRVPTFFFSFPLFPKQLYSIVVFQIPLDRYLPTWRGNVIDAKLEMNPARILGMSLSVNAEGGVPGARSGPGDFRAEIDWIKALRAQ